MQEFLHRQASGSKVIPKTDNWDGVVVLMLRLGLGHKLFTFPRTLSGGMKRTLWLGIALIGEPTIVFLDEPTSGVDPLGHQLLWHLISDKYCDNNASYG